MPHPPQKGERGSVAGGAAAGGVVGGIAGAAGAAGAGAAGAAGAGAAGGSGGGAAAGAREPELLTHKSAQGGYNYYAADDPYGDYDDGYQDDGYDDRYDDGYQESAHWKPGGDDDRPGPDEMSTRRGRRRKVWRRVRRTCYVAATLMLLVPLGIATYGYLTWQVPDPVAIAKGTEQVVTIKYASGEDLAKIVPNNGKRRTMINSMDEVSKPMQDATLAAEDASFYSNPGFSITGILGAVKNQFTAGVGGGSTLTQQYIKNILDQRDYSITRKFKEVVLAFKMTNEQTKQNILMAYMNTAYYGRGAWGIHAGAEAYFGKLPSELNESEAAVLGGVVQLPNDNDPRWDPERAAQRWDYVAGQMRENNFVSAEKYATMKQPDTRPRDEWREDTDGAGSQNHIRKQVEEELQRKGYDERTLARGGYTVHTTIDKRAQDAAEASVQKVTEGEPEELRTSLVAVDPENGGVRAYYGGGAEFSFDYAASPQPPGSSFKPFVALAGLEQGKGLGETYDGSSPQDIEGTEFENSEGINCDEPKRCDVREAMTKSVNTAFVNMATKVGATKVAKAAHQAGIPDILDDTKTLQNDDGTVDAGIALGAYPVRTIDMAGAYATFVNNGMKVTPRFVSKVTNGETTDPLGAGNAEPAFAEEGDEPTDPTVSKNLAANVIDSMLEVADESDLPLDGDRPVASKTGTHQLGDTGHNQNAWMVGATPQLSAAVGMLSEDEDGVAEVLDSSGKDVYGSGLPGEIWQEFMNTYHEGLPVRQFPKPDPSIGQSEKKVIKSSSSVPPPSRPSSIPPPTTPTLPTESTETSPTLPTDSTEPTTSEDCPWWGCPGEGDDGSPDDDQNAIGTTRQRSAG